MKQKDEFVSGRVRFVFELANIKSNDKVLNIGLGWNTDVEQYFEQRAKEMWSADNDRIKIEKAAKKLKSTRIKYMDAEKEFPFKANYFDKVILLEVLEHIKNEEFALKQINRVLKKDGSLIISVPEINMVHILSPINYMVHYRHYTKKSFVNKLKKAGFEIEELTMVGAKLPSYLNLYWAVLRRRLFGVEIADGDVLFRKKYHDSFKLNGKSGMSILVKARKIKNLS